MNWFSNDNLAVSSGLLTPASSIYGLIVRLRLKAYDKGILKRHQIAVPIISIGNLTVGGTGKTPVTIDLAQRLIANGLKVAILSRGYKRLSTEKVVIVSNGQQIFATAQEAGDEPYMMAKELPSAVVITGASRVSTAQIAANLYNCNVILLDDGFQHLLLHRRDDVVLLDYNQDLLK